MNNLDISQESDYTHIITKTHPFFKVSLLVSFFFFLFVLSLFSFFLILTPP